MRWPSKFLGVSLAKKLRDCSPYRTCVCKPHGTEYRAHHEREPSQRIRALWISWPFASKVQAIKPIKVSPLKQIRPHTTGKKSIIFKNETRHIQFQNMDQKYICTKRWANTFILRPIWTWKNVAITGTAIWRYLQKNQRQENKLTKNGAKKCYWLRPDFHLFHVMPVISHRRFFNGRRAWFMFTLSILQTKFDNRTFAELKFFDFAGYCHWDAVHGFEE